jgi:hypothetical protein
MVIWLAVFYSALCEYHGLMLPFGPDSMAHMHSKHSAHNNDTMPMTMTVHVHHPGMDMQMASLMPNAGKSNTFMQFSRMALSTVAMSFLTIAAPSTFTIPLRQQQSSFIVVTRLITHQWGLLPPEQPPRHLPLV